jgi:Flp pilus assembly protein TadB
MTEQRQLVISHRHAMIAAGAVVLVVMLSFFFQFTVGLFCGFVAGVVACRLVVQRGPVRQYSQGQQ